MTIAGLAQIAGGLLVVAGAMAAYIAIKTHNARQSLPAVPKDPPATEETENQEEP